MSELMTLRAESGGAEFSLQSDAIAVDTDHTTLLLASVIGAGSQVQAFAAMLQANNVKATFRQNHAMLLKFAGGYDCHKAKLGYGTWHLLAIARRPGLLLDSSDAALWRELRSDRYTTPILKAWLPALRARLTAAELLTVPRQRGCSIALLTADTEKLDEIVSRSVDCGEFPIK